MKSMIGIIMGSKSDFDIMREATTILDELQIPYETKVVSAHRTPQYMFNYAQEAYSR
ncbi:MAG: AIR carboxylase family protein, partial [Chitinophagia bacterium]|nr:AIR carboxylase family protein [Chitinophagia bacterium]